MEELRPAARLRELEAGVSLQDALAFFDALPPATTESMLGQWRGSAAPTGNPMDGLLEAFGWYGKRFESPDDVHPLVFQTQRGLLNVNPAGLPLGVMLRFSSVLDNPAIVAVAKRALRLRQTSRPSARLRMVEYRGVTSATMIYDALPINDHFRRVDEDTLLGAMDMRGLAQPFMFVLRRDAK